MTSSHTMSSDGASAPMWGAGLSASDEDAQIGGFSCTGCHDPHGSSNYRLLKDTVNNVAVGGYDSNGVPDPTVVSAELNYPQEGWYKGDMGGRAQIDLYVPDYTSTHYLQGEEVDKNISVWCAACHTEYNVVSSPYGYELDDVEFGELGEPTGINLDGEAAPVDGIITRTRHRVNMSMSVARDVLVLGEPTNTLATQVVTDTLLPLEQPRLETNPDWVKSYDDFIGCLTCHVAHGTDKTMSGWANAELVPGVGAVDWVPSLRLDDEDNLTDGVNPTFSSALLRADNRGVCNRCHDK